MSTNPATQHEAKAEPTATGVQNLRNPVIFRQTIDAAAANTASSSNVAKKYAKVSMVHRFSSLGSHI